MNGGNMARSRQSGIGLFGFIVIMGLIGYFSLVTIKMIPLYLNEMKVKRAVHAVAIDPDNADKDVAYITERLQRRWDVEDTRDDLIKPEAIKVVKMKDGRRHLKYDYDAREKLFYNIFVVVQFTGDEAMRVPSSQ
jgi:hypothetical protein